MNYDAFISDTHFSHKKIIEYCARPFSSVEEMNEKLIENYNQFVGEKDVVLWLGDCFFCSQTRAKEILSRLNGKKHLIVGNHDFDCMKMTQIGFELVSQKMYAKMANRTIVLSHYDSWNYRSQWDGRYEERRHRTVSNEIIFHGHTHAKSRVKLNEVHLGVDAWDFRPARREEVESIVREIPDDYSTKQWKEKEVALFEYRELLRNNPQSLELKNPKFDWLKSLGWESETKERMK